MNCTDPTFGGHPSIDVQNVPTVLKNSKIGSMTLHSSPGGYVADTLSSETR